MKELNIYLRIFLPISTIFCVSLDWIFDIVFYTQLTSIEEGLVIGKLKPLSMGVLAFCIIGAMILIPEIVLIILKYKKKTGKFDIPIYALLWAEDLPQTVITFCVAYCGGMPVISLQLVKMAFLFILAVLVNVDLYINLKVTFKKCKSVCKIILSASYLVWCLTLLFILARKNRGIQTSSTYHNISSTFNLNDEYNYFTNVSIFLNQPLYFDNDDLASDKLNTESNWIHLISIDQLRSMPRTEVSVVLQYQNTGSNMLSLVLRKENITTSKDVANTWMQSLCYTFDTNSKALKVIETTSCPPGTILKEIFIKFRYDPPTKYLFYGNIVYKAMKLENQVCEPMKDYTGELNLPQYSSITLKMRYFRTHYIEGIQPLKREKGESRFFKIGSTSYHDFTDVNEFWKTELLKCTTNGNRSPKVDSSISANC